MELSLFYNYFIPTTFSFFSAQGARIDYHDMPTDQEWLDTLGINLLGNNYGVQFPGFNNKVGINNNLFSFDVEDLARAKLFLDTVGIVAKSTAIEVGEQIKEFFKGFTRSTADTVSNAIVESMSNPVVEATPTVAVNFTAEQKSTMKNLASLIASGALVITATVDGMSYGTDITWTDSLTLKNQLSSVFAEHGILLSGDSCIDNIDAYVGNNMSKTKTFAGTINNLINGRVIPWLAFTVADDNVELSNLVFGINLSGGLNIGITTDPSSVDMYVTRYQHRRGGITYGSDYKPGVSVDPPYQTETYVDPLTSSTYTIYMFNNGSYGSLHLRPDTNVLLWDTSAAFTDDFFSEMTQEQIEDVNNYVMDIYIENNHKISDVTTYPAVVDSNISSKLLLDEYDILSSGNSADAISRALEAVTNVITTGAINAITSTRDIANTLPASVNVYPVDTDTDTTITDTPLSIADALADIISRNNSNGASKGVSDSRLASATGDYGLFTLYKMTLAQLKQLASKLWSSDFITNFHPFKNDPSEALISLMAYPIDITADGSDSPIICGNYNCSPASGKKVNNLFQTHSMGSVQIPNKFNNFMDYTPYTKISLYLPFIGIVSLDPDEVMGSKITITYRTELLTGTCVASVRVEKGTLNATLYQYTGNMGLTLPLSASDFGRTYTSLMTSGIGAIAGLGGAIMSGNPAVGAIALGNVAQVASGAIQGKPDIKKSGGMSGNSGMCGNMCAYVIIDTVVPDVPQSFESLKGSPNNKYMSVRNLSGFVQLDSYHLTIPNMTDDEKKELDDILHNGFII